MSAPAALSVPLQHRAHRRSAGLDLDIGLDLTISDGLSISASIDIEIKLADFDRLKRYQQDIAGKYGQAAAGQQEQREDTHNTISLELDLLKRDDFPQSVTSTPLEGQVVFQEDIEASARHRYPDFPDSDDNLWEKSSKLSLSAQRYD